MRKITVLILIIIAVLITGIGNYFYFTNFRLKKEIKELDKKKEVEVNRRIIEERNAIKKDLEEKYQADRVSYEAMARRLELEKQKVKDLQIKRKK